jgi:hypothetical protein
MTIFKKLKDQSVINIKFKDLRMHFAPILSYIKFKASKWDLFLLYSAYIYEVTIPLKIELLPSPS